MNDSRKGWFPIGSFTARMLLVGLLAIASLVGTGCSLMRPPVTTACTNILATVAYYYRYKEATPDLSDIAFIEVVPSGPRCIIPSSTKAPVFPDSAVSQFVKDGKMKIDIPDGKDMQIVGKADIAVYYAGPASAPIPTPVAVENLKGVSRMIETVGVMDEGSPGCGLCASVPCDGYSCCKRPPCP
jgi:hypothetical protein